MSGFLTVARDGAAIGLAWSFCYNRSSVELSYINTEMHRRRLLTSIGIWGCPPGSSTFPLDSAPFLIPMFWYGSLCMSGRPPSIVLWTVGRVSPTETFALVRIYTTLFPEVERVVSVPLPREVDLEARGVGSGGAARRPKTFER